MPKPKSSRKQTRSSPKTKHVLAPPPGRLGQPGVAVSDPQFGETKYTPDPTQFLHAVTDKQYYKVVDKETVNQLIQSIPPPRDPKNLLLSLADVYGSKGSVKV